ncbi:MAG: ATPase, partial [Oliverpabstia sp.]
IFHSYSKELYNFFRYTQNFKKYLSLKLEEFMNEKRSIKFYLDHHTSHIKSEELLSTDSGYHELLLPFFTPLSQELTDWMNCPYQKNPLYSEQLIHKSVSGHLLRSKSESIIDTFLYINKIPFRYECALTLGEVVLFPDFTIRHPRTGQIYYWEHFGLMDQSPYSQKTYAKLQLYTTYGIIPSIHLITTYETKEYPLSSEIVEKIIQYYFL